MDPGLEFPDIVNLQDNHRSGPIFDAEETGVFKCRTHLKSKKDFVVHDSVANFISTTQFNGLLQLCYVEINADLITALVKRWRQETHSFHLPFGESDANVFNYNKASYLIDNMPLDTPLVYGQVLRSMRKMSLEALQNTKQGHRIQVEEEGDDDGDDDGEGDDDGDDDEASLLPPRYNFRNLIQRQEIENPQPSTSQVRKTKRGRR